ncbi:hypothetical protein G4B88_025782, partial [Cannabis sativa]
YIIYGGPSEIVAFFDKRISQEVSGDCLGEEFKGYVRFQNHGFQNHGWLQQASTTRKNVYHNNKKV